MVSLVFKAILLALVSMVHMASAAEIVTVAMLFDLENPTANCSSVSGKLWRVTNRALEAAGMTIQENKHHWHGYFTDESDEVHIEEINDDTDTDLYNHGDASSGRRLCDSFCQFMCNSQGRYCSCCSCCGNGRRRTRGLKTGTIPDGHNITKLQEDAASAATAELDLWQHRVACLAHPYKVTTFIMQHDVDDVTDPSDNGSDNQAEQSCQREWHQCGGEYHNGPTCCGEGSTCEHSNDWYSQCVPEKDDGSGCIRRWGKCGGVGYNGETCCVNGSKCKEYSEWYSQCVPNGWK